ncbi:hypothetical protein ANOM_004018 [Aspergillus nomiae NRRL 13137]|uniref:Uncharacterized protein n=1 Tax=Aspergillus nomiae NRRL (strain ATCC 15546 / NRRL 13137 / CBS 260.88 / M93) TaxID=1509407 RepID=A0A0L1J6H5_ASPN3|nr:uncharacterized protein ANOM_004018 [Aspergillus nomiae NRRL 13137]KNG87416.1 hypothetical protein ANOM_004018 [Aspergillus nomiae NRRL 13137]
MGKKGGKGKSKNKGGKAGGAAAAAVKQATDIQNPVTPGHEVEETVAKGEGEVSDVVTEPTEAATAGPTTTVPDATPNLPSAAPPASTEEAREILQDAVNKAETGLADKAELANGEAIGAVEPSVTEEPLKLTPENLAPTAGTETSLPERPKETVTDTFDAHAKRPYEGSLTAKDDELPHKIAKVDDTVAAAGATSGHVAETGSLARKPEVPAETGSVQPQIVPGLGADPNDHVSTVLNVPGLSSLEEKSTAPSATEASAVPASSTSTEPKCAEDIAPTGAPTSDVSADATEKPKQSEVPTAEEETITEPKGAEDIAPTGAPTSAGKVDLVEQPKDSEISKAEETVASEPPTAAAVTSEPEAPSGATAPSEIDSTAKAASATAGAGTATATSAPPAAEPVLKVPSSIHDGPDSKVTSADQAVSKVEQEAQVASDSTQAALKDSIPQESKPAPEVQEGTAAVKAQLPENQPAAKEAQEAGAGAAKEPQEIQKPEEAKTKEPRAVQDAQEESAATAKKPEELKPEDIKKPEEAKTKEPQAAQATPADTTSKPEEGKSLIDQAKETVQTEASKAQETAKAEAAKLEKRKSGFFGWFKRKLKGEKA